MNHITTKKQKWARFSNNSYEVSSSGDKRFSALFARLNDGRTIEEAYQLDIKGYRKITNNWREAKGKPPLNNISKDKLYELYKNLWRQWASENIVDFLDLMKVAEGKYLTDKYASSNISQARALSELINELRGS